MRQLSYLGDLTLQEVNWAYTLLQMMAFPKRTRPKMGMAQILGRRITPGTSPGQAPRKAELSNCGILDRIAYDNNNVLDTINQ